MNTEEIADHWWEGNDFLYKTEDGTITRLANAYLASMTFEGLDADPTDQVVIENYVEWKTTSQQKT